MRNKESNWRGLIAQCCGGADFDAPGGGYAFSAVLAKERELEEGNVCGDPSSALLKLSIADPTWKMPEEAMMASMAYYQHCPDATRYTDNYGAAICHQAGIFHSTNTYIAAYLESAFHESKVAFSDEWVQFSPGAIKRALAEYIPTLFFDDRSLLFFPTPGYPVIRNDMNRRGAVPADSLMCCRGGRWGYQLDKMNPLIDPTRFTKFFMYVNMPHNPTGTGFRREDWENLLSWAKQQGVTLIVDEAYIDLRYNPDCVSVLTVPGWEDCCVVLQSVSKGWSATGLRFGWMIAHPTLIKALRKVTDVKDSGPFGPSIAAGLALLQDPQHAVQTRLRYFQLHDNLHKGLSTAGFSPSMPDAGLCQFTPAPRSAGGRPFADVYECASWFREKLRISLMPYMVGDEPWLRWAVTIKPVPECGLPDEKSVIDEVVRRLSGVKFEFSSLD